MKQNDTLQTPEYVYKALGEIDLDPCAGVNTNIGKVNYAIERGENGLELPWDGFVFCNPPFSQKELWIERMKEHNNGIMLLPERGSAPWFTDLICHCCFYWVMGKKINFIGGTSSSNIGSCLFPFGVKAINNLCWRVNLPGHFVSVGRVISREQMQVRE